MEGTSTHGAAAVAVGESNDPVPLGATAVVSHRVRADAHRAYESWLAEVLAVSSEAPGYLDAQVFRPIAKITSIYTVVLRFDTAEHLSAWLGSTERQALIVKAEPLLAADDAYVVRSGLDFWYHAPAEANKQPARWKQALVTWSAIFPLVLLLPSVVGPVLRGFGVPPNRYFDVFVVSGNSVVMMVYLVMPPYVKLFQRWFRA